MTATIKTLGGELFLSDRFPPSAPWNAMQSARLADSVAPRVQAARRKIERLASKAITLPFPDYPLAVKWLGEVEASESAASKRKAPNSKQGQASQATAVPYTMEEDTWTHRAMALPGGPLHALARATSDIAKLTGFHETSVVALILADLPPLLKPVEVRWTARPVTSNAGRVTWRSEVSITIRTPEIDESDLRFIRRQIRRVWGAAKQKGITEKDRKLHDAVMRDGGLSHLRSLPRGEKRPYWEGIGQQLKLGSGDAVRKRWVRLQKKLDEFDGPPPILRDH